MNHTHFVRRSDTGRRPFDKADLMVCFHEAGRVRMVLIRPGAAQTYNVMYTGTEWLYAKSVERGWFVEVDLSLTGITVKDIVKEMS